MGQIEGALICYQKSAILMERHLLSATNKAYARTWIGELLAARGDAELAQAFLSSALRLWEKAAPPKTMAVVHALRELQRRFPEVVRANDRDAEKICLDWILGKAVYVKDT